MWTVSLPVVASALVLLLFSYLAWVRPERYVRAWIWFWGLLTLREAAQAALHFWPLSVLHWAEATLLTAAAAVLLLSARALRQIPVQGRTYLWLATVGAGWAYVAWYRPLPLAPLSSGALAAAMLLAAAYFFLLSPVGCWARRFCGIAVLVWGGIEYLLYRYPPGLGSAPLAEVAAPLLLAITMGAVVFEEERRAMEEHLLGLSMLNLSGGSQAQSGGLPQVLNNLLDRLRNIVQVRQVALWAGPPLLPEPIEMSRGFSTDFRQFLSLTAGPRLVEILPRYGGLVVGRWRHPTAPIPGLETEPFFNQIRQQLAAEGDTGFTCLSLQSRKRTFGLLLLGQMGHRRFLPGELRFLLALSTQTSVALENLSLIKASLRRSEEFEILTHIGTALSSSLTLDHLLRLIHAELQKLIDVRNFYVAFHEEASDEIHFELEVEDGAILPKRARPRRNALTEHVLTTGTHLLVPGDVAEFSRQNGFARSGRNAQSWLGVPIIIHGRAVGVMAVQNYERVGAYDQDHVRILEIVAGQAAVAIENAHLFAEQQSKTQQLEFLNQISKLAISTLDPEEMLVAMAREIQKHFPFDRIGVGVINYQNKELEFKAEAGRKSTAGGSPLRRLPLGVGIVGAAARTGQLMLVNDLRQNPQAIPVHGDSGSALAIPITFGGQTLGILNLECDAPQAFSPAQLPILRTLADQLSVALNNALTFQQMQQQAITDSLTGLKTRRYFMESLQSEWKRASRYGLPFSVVLVDLDNFKSINDTLGHLEGDLTLARLARILEERGRGSNIVARYGGDEFTILMPEANAEKARALCERMRVLIASEPSLSERQLRASFGLASYPEHGSTPEEVLHAADIAMYAAKGSGGDRVIAAHESKAVIAAPSALLSFADSEQTEFAAALNGFFALAVATDSKDALGPEHSLRVSRYGVLLAQGLKLSELDQERIRIAGRLHDIGKSSMAAELLHKRQPDPAEWAMLRSHPLTGAEMVAGLRGGEEIASFIATHHEWFDGSGYPRGLRGDDIPLGGRILALAEAFDAMTSSTGHRPALTFAEAGRELEVRAGRQFDPLLVRIFLRALQEEGSLLAAAAHNPQ